MTHDNTQFASIPMRKIGPIKISGAEVNDELEIPLATFETPLWSSTHRGARVTLQSGGINVAIVHEKMTRSVVFQCPNVQYAQYCVQQLDLKKDVIAVVVRQTSRFAHLNDIHCQIVGNLLYVRNEFITGDASGHNMTTLASEKIMEWMLETFTQLTYISISANLCTDKKVSAVNGLLGRGKYVVAETIIPNYLCRRYLRATPEKIVEINLKKNLIGSCIAGSLRSANAHFANMLLALYLATGQDAANIIEGSQGIVFTELVNDDLYFSITLPNVIVGTVGNGKHLPFVEQNLKDLGCLQERSAGDNARRLAIIVGATVLCGELSLLAAQTNPGELMESHIRIERNQTERS